MSQAVPCSSTPSARPAPPSPGPDPHAAQPWVRLWNGEDLVGYCRAAGGSKLYSPDGYAWSGTFIPSTHEDLQVPYRCASKRVFHGDWLLTAATPGTDEPVRLLVLADENHGVAFFDPKGPRIYPGEDAREGASVRWFSRVLGPTPQDPVLLVASSMLEQASASGSSNTTRVAGALSLVLILCVFMTGLLQQAVTGFVGPLAPSFGALLGSMAFWAVLRRRTSRPISREQLKGVGLRTAAVLSLVGGLLGPLPLLVGEGNFSLESLAARALALGVFGALLGAGTTVLGGDLVAWRSGGYRGGRSIVGGPRRHQR